MVTVSYTHLVMCGESADVKKLTAHFERRILLTVSLLQAYEKNAIIIADETGVSSNLPNKTFS